MLFLTSGLNPQGAKKSIFEVSTKGIGRFKPLEGAKPAIGKMNKIESVPEVRIETICDQNNLASVLRAIKTIHPYEEPAVDIYKLESFGYL